jgi:hypothetical protein
MSRSRRAGESSKQDGECNQTKTYLLSHSLYLSEGEVFLELYDHG